MQRKTLWESWSYLVSIHLFDPDTEKMLGPEEWMVVAQDVSTFVEFLSSFSIPVLRQCFKWVAQCWKSHPPHHTLFFAPAGSDLRNQTPISTLDLAGPTTVTVTVNSFTHAVVGWSDKLNLLRVLGCCMYQPWPYKMSRTIGCITALSASQATSLGVNYLVVRGI